MTRGSALIAWTDEIGIDGVVLFFALAVAVTAGVIFGLAPAIQGSRTDVHDLLKSGGARTGGPSGQGMRNAFLVSQVAMALVLVVGSGLLLRSFRKLQTVDPGFNAENLVAMRMAPPSARYATDVHVATFYDQLLERLAAVPGLTSVGATTNLPLFGSINFSFLIEGRPPVQSGTESPTGNFRIVTPEYLGMMGIPVLRGRGFTVDDDASSPSVVIVNERLVRRYFPDEDPIGQRLNVQVGLGTANCPCEVVGVVADIKQRGLEDESAPGYYLPSGQAYWPSRVVVARTTLASSEAISAMRAAVAAVDPSLAVYDVQTLEQRIADSIEQPRFNTIMLGIFAAVALVIAMIGIYGVMSYNVGRRTHEMGVRVALGAGAHSITRLVVGRALVLAGVGIAIGIGIASATTRFLSGMLFDVSPLDGPTFVAVAVLLVGVAVVAAYVPARRAARVDPVSTLRGE